MDLVNGAPALPLHKLKVPTLVIFTDKDAVVDLGVLQHRFDELAAEPKLVVNLPEATRHELTGDALAPQAVAPVIRHIRSFLADLGRHIAK